MDEQKRKQLFNDLKKILEEVAPTFTTYNNPGKYSLYTKKLIAVGNKKPEETYFAGLRELKNIVGFYFMPIYVCPEMRSQVPPSLQKILKGNTCFNVKTLTPEMIEDLRSLLQVGIAAYKKNGWL